MIERKRSDAAAQLAFAAEAELAGDFQRALSHFMKAHGFSQRFRRDHARVHWLMAAFAVRRHHLAEALNQLVLAFGAAIYIQRSRSRQRIPKNSPTASRPTCT